MDRPATANPASAREVILEITRNLREGLEPLRYSTLAPSVYQVFLHPSDMDRLRGIIPRIIDEARQALDAEIEELNRAPLAERLKLSRSSRPKIVAPEGGWQIRILENTDDDVEPGDIVIYSELAMPAKPEFGAGCMTKRIATRRIAGAQTSARESFEPVQAQGQPAETGVFATIEYEDNGGRKQFIVTKDEIVVGRGGRDYWTDLKLDTLPDVSREHFRLRRDPATNTFYLKDLSRLGTTVNGEKAPSSIEFTEGEKHDRNVEVPLPATARIGLANVIFLEFRSGANG
jgi:hypothetical protein